ncbi:MAG: hypothetical protein WA208_02185 [Thermoanaerobaculia bacterium]
MPTLRSVFVVCAVALGLFAQAVLAQTIPVGGMSVARVGAASVRLLDGRVLVVGGAGGTDRSAELFDPHTRRFSRADQLVAARAVTTATLLPSGEVLVLGSTSSANSMMAEVFNPSTNRFRTTYGTPAFTRQQYTATLLDTGQVLVAGGARNSAPLIAQAELYDPASETFTPVGEMVTPRVEAISAKLADGRVLFVGGRGYSGLLHDAEVFDPTTKRFTAVGSAIGEHVSGSAVTLSSGDVLIVGGISSSTAGTFNEALVEAFDPALGTFRRLPDLPMGSRCQAIALASGDVVLAGAGPAYDAILVRPSTSDRFAVTASMSATRSGHTSTALADGSLLIAGGMDPRGPSAMLWSSAELYVPSPTYQTTRIIPVVGSTPGASGSYFKSVVQVHSTHTEPISYQVAFRPLASPTDIKRKTFTLQPGQTAVFDDILLDLGTSGIGTMDIESLPDRAPEVFVHVFNDTGAGTSGFTQRGVHPTKALSAGQRGLMFAPQNASYRMNVGVRALASGATISVAVIDGNGVERTKVTKEYGPNAFQQVDAASFLGTAVVAGDVIRVSIAAGSAIVYSSQTDNVTNDSAFSMVEPIF